jgi:hypothetical protein
MIALVDREFTYLAANQTYLDAFAKTADQVVVIPCQRSWVRNSFTRS